MDSFASVAASTNEQVLGSISGLPKPGSRFPGKGKRTSRRAHATPNSTSRNDISDVELQRRVTIHQGTIDTPPGTVCDGRLPPQEAGPVPAAFQEPVAAPPEAEPLQKAKRSAGAHCVPGSPPPAPRRGRKRKGGRKEVCPGITVEYFFICQSSQSTFPHPAVFVSRTQSKRRGEGESGEESGSFPTVGCT